MLSHWNVHPDNRQKDFIFTILVFREEQEKLNIWVAYLNLENMYGTHESLMETFDRAVKENDPLSVYQQLITIYIGCGKIEVIYWTTIIGWFIDKSLDRPF